MAWLLVLACCIVMTTFYTLSWGICSTDEIQWDRDGGGEIDFYPLHFLFPSNAQKVNLLVKGQLELKMFCIDYVQRAEVMFILATISCTLVVISLVHFLMALAANYAHIRGHDKFTDLADLHALDVTSETMTLTERGEPQYNHNM